MWVRGLEGSILGILFCFFPIEICEISDINAKTQSCMSSIGNCAVLLFVFLLIRNIHLPQSIKKVYMCSCLMMFQVTKLNFLAQV